MTQGAHPAGPGPVRAPRVLVTRPEPGLGETVSAIIALGLMPVACPMLRIAPRDLSLVPARPTRSPDHAFVFTSGQAVPALARALERGLLAPDTRLFAVGDRSADRARAAGFTRVMSAAGAARDLLALIARSVPPGTRLVLATGAHEGQDIAAGLRGIGYRVVRRIAYVARPETMIAPDIMASWREDPLAALFFSAATARAFETASAAADRRTCRRATAIALSANVARALPAAHWGRIVVAGRPDAASMLAALGRVAEQGGAS